MVPYKLKKFNIFIHFILKEYTKFQFYIIKNFPKNEKIYLIFIWYHVKIKIDKTYTLTTNNKLLLQNKKRGKHYGKETK